MEPPTAVGGSFFASRHHTKRAPIVRRSRGSVPICGSLRNLRLPLREAWRVMGSNKPHRRSTELQAGVFGRLVGLLALLGGAGLLLYALVSQDASRSQPLALALAYGPPVGALALGVLLLRLAPERRDALALVFSATIVGAYIAEGSLWTLAAVESPELKACRAGLAAPVNRVATTCLPALKQGVDFDVRSRLEVIEELEALGRPRVVPGLSPDARSDALPTQIFPLAQISNASVVLCAEAGEYLVFSSDAHGFRNPPGQEDAPIALIGDSFTQGVCVDEEQTLAGQLRTQGRRVRNLGVAGAGPLSTLAIAKEYLAQTRPRDVVWVFYEATTRAKGMVS